MKRCCIYILPALIGLVICQAALSQSKEWNRDDLMRYAGNIHQFNGIFPQEKVYLQFDNTGYYQGETIWFKAFVVNASGLTRTRSTVLYVDLLSPNGVLLEQKKLKIIAGQADGCFVLMDGSTEQARELRGILPYPSGYYEIRAYTQYMLNFNQHLEFSRVLLVFKTPLRNGFHDQPVMANLAQTLIDQHRPEGNKNKSVNVSFYPEGGVLLGEVHQHVAFKATDENGLPVDGEVRISGGGLKPPIVAKTEHDGMGSFYINANFRNLKADFLYDGKNYKVSLPKIEQKGYSLILTNDYDSLRVMAYRGFRSRKREKVGVTVTCRGELIGYTSFYMSSDSVKFSLPREGWPMGVCQLTLFNLSGDKLSTRCFFNHRSDYQAPTLTATTDKENYGPYDPIKIDFDLKNRQGKSFRDRFCISVRDASPTLITAYADDLATTLLLSSDIKGLINNPQYYFETDDEEHRKAMDLLMQVQGWERYDWMYMSNNSFFVEEHRMEDSLSVNGWITSFWNNKKKLEGVNTYITITPYDNDSIVEYGMYTTEKIGYFGFNTKDFYGKADLVILLENKGNFAEGTNANLILQRSDLPEVRAYLPEELVLKPLEYHPFGRIVEDKKEEIVIVDGLVIPEVEVNARKYIDYFTFKAYDIEQYVETTIDFGKWPTDLMGYFLNLGYTVATGADGIYSTAKSNRAFKNYMRSDDDYGSEGYAFYQSGLLDGDPVFWYIHDSRGLVYPFGVPMDGRNSAYGVFDQDVWTIDTEDIESILVFDKPAKITEIAESVPLFMDAIRRSMNYEAERFMEGNVSTRKYLLIDVLMKDGYKLKTKQEKRNRGKRITTLRGFNRPVQFYSPEYPDGPVEGTEDYRRTLYWNPNVITDSLGHAQIEFYNNSYSTRFNVSGAGITAGGSPYVLDMDF